MMALILGEGQYQLAGGVTACPPTLLGGRLFMAIGLGRQAGQEKAIVVVDSNLPMKPATNPRGYAHARRTLR